MNYYSKFIRNISVFLHPLYELLKKSNKFIWSKQCDSAFREVKEKLSSNDVLIHFQPHLPIKLIDGASNYGIGAMICHVVENNMEKPIAYALKVKKIFPKLKRKV